MDLVTLEDKTFEKVIYSGKLIKGREFINCTFRSCDLSNSDFSFNKFMDCHFEECNLTMAKFKGSTLNNAVFRSCKILGVHFNECDDFLFNVQFTACILDYASFARKKMPKTIFFDSSLKEVSFIQANLSGARFDRSDLSGAIFNETDLTATDFRSAYHYSLDPESNIIKKAIFSVDGLPGLLTKYPIKIV